MRAEISGILPKTEPSDSPISKDFSEEKSGKSRINPLKIEDKIEKSDVIPMQYSSLETINSEDSSGTSDITKAAFEVTSELILQPHQAPVSSGGGGGNDSGDWGDEDKKKRKSGRKR